MSYILALDQGTTSSRALIIDKKGDILVSSQKEFSQFFPTPGWVEHDPMEIWQSQRDVAIEAMRQSALCASDIAAIGIANQRESTIVWDRATGIPLYPCIVWQDRRTSEYCNLLREKGMEPLFSQKTGLVLDPYFSGTKLRWILKNIPGANQKALRGELAFGTVDSWLVWQLTEGKKHMTDITNASRTLLFNIHTCEWDEELLTILEIPRSLLPTVCNSSEVYGESNFLGSPIPISGIAGDQQAALFGQLCLKPGEAKTTYGTGAFMLMHTGTTPVFSEHHLLTTMACKVDENKQYALEGSVFVAGAVVQWLRDSLGIIKTSEEIETLASSVPDNDGVYFVPAFTGLGAPHWDPHVRAMILGLTRGASKAHIARAALESIAFQVTDVLEAMQLDSKIAFTNLKVDGGASANNLLMQFQADLIGVPVIRPKSTEVTGLGVAYLAGLAVHFWENMDEIKQLRKADKQFLPSADEKIKSLKDHWKRALDCAQYWEGHHES